MASLTRRRLLGIAALSAALPPAILASGANMPSFGPASPMLAALGRSYLAAHPDEAFAQRLLRGIAGENPLPHTRAAWRALIRERRAEEFARADTVIVEGWILARCEARLCALQAIS